jgi:Meckel syndrome type 1 protein
MESEEAKEKLVFEEFFKRLQISRQEALPFPKFDMIPTMQLKYYARCEISRIVDFNCDFVFIEYIVNAGKNWKLDNGNTQGVTQIATCEKDSKYQSFANFSFPLEICLIGKDVDQKFENPLIYLKVLSLDSLNRQRVEGYGCCELDIDPGCLELEIKCWKPKLHFQSELKSFFLGGSPDLLDLVKFNQSKVLIGLYRNWESIIIMASKQSLQVLFT